MKMTDYQEGSLKVDPDTKSVAIRTNQPDEAPSPFRQPASWLIGTTNQGAILAGSAAVADWVDVPAEVIDRIDEVVAYLAANPVGT